MQVSTSDVQGRHTAERTQLLRPLLFILFPIAFILLLLFLKLYDPTLYRGLIREDALFEILTVIMYVGAALAALVLVVTLRQLGERRMSLLYLGVSLGFMYIAGEEISWGQRILQIESPAFFERYNQQQELNSHNFLNRYLLHAVYMLIASCAAFGWALLPRAIRHLPATWQSFLRPRLWMLAPDRRLMLYFLPCLLLYFYFDYINNLEARLFGQEYNVHGVNMETLFMHPRDQEPIEMLMAVGFLFTVALILRRTLHMRAEARA